MVVHQVLPVVEAELDEGGDEGAILLGLFQLLFVCGERRDAGLVLGDFFSFGSNF